MTVQEGTQATATFAKEITFDILNSDIKVPPMPSNGSRLMSMAQEPIKKIDISEFCKLIEPDPGLFSMVLQLANSPFYRGVDQIVSLRNAITRIGLQESINSVNLYFLQRFLPNLSELHGFSAKDYWAFSWACATTGRRLGHPNLTTALPGELYIAGLLHGIGKLILAIHHSKAFFMCIEKAKSHEQPLHIVLLDELGTTDNMIAARLMAAWNLPSRICNAVEFFQNPLDAPQEYREIAGFTQLAYRIAAMSQIGNNGDGILQDLESAWISEQTNRPISKQAFQKGLVEEILTTLTKKSESITGVSPPEKKTASEPKLSTGRQQPPAESNKTRSNHKKLSHTDSSPPKKGFLGWIKSLFS